jgi:hypothetical protein
MSSWYPDSSAIFFIGTCSVKERPTVPGATIGPGHAAKMMQLKKTKAKDASFFHRGQSFGSQQLKPASESWARSH